MTLAVISEGVLIALITSAAAAAAGVTGVILKLMFNIAKNSSAVEVNSAIATAKVESLESTIGNGLETQTREIGKVVQSVDRLTQAVDEHSHILRDHDARLSRVEDKHE